MFSSIKRLTRHSLVYGVGHIISRFLGFLLLPLHTNVFQPEVYRTPILLFTALALMNVFFSYWMDVAFMRFFVLEEKKDEKRRIFSTAFWMILCTGLCCSLLVLLFPEPFSRLIFRETNQTQLIRLGAGILLFDALCLIPFLLLRAEERSTQFIVLKSANIFINLTLNVVFIAVMKCDVEFIFVANLIASAATLSLLFPVIKRWLRFSFSRWKLKELLRFGLPYVPSGLAVLIMDLIGRFFLDRMLGKESTGIFSAGYKLGMIMALVVAAFRFAWHPFFLSTSKEENAPQIFSRVFTYFLFVTSSFFLLVSFFIHEIVGFELFGKGILGKGYAAGAYIVPVVMLAYIGYGAYANFVVGIYLKKKTVYLPFVTGIGALTALLANRLLIPPMGIMGAAWAVLLAYTAMACTLFFVSRRLYPIPYEGFRILRLVVVVAMLFFLGTQTGFDASFLARAGLFILFIPLLWLIRFFHTDEIEFLKTIPGRIFPKKK